MQDNTPLIGQPKPQPIKLEVPAVFGATLFFINHQGQFTTVQFALPPGLHPNPKWLEKSMEDAYRQSLKALKLSTKDLSWRKCTPSEFVRASSNGQQGLVVDSSWQPAYSVVLEFEKLPEAPEVEEKTDGV